MWIHESFTTTLKVFFGILLWEKAGFEYVRGIRKIFKTISQL
jgi:hypothetical protein